MSAGSPAGKIALHVERIDLRHTVLAAVEASRPLIEEMGHEFTASVPAGPVFLNADPVRFAQILSNLLNNAAKYTPPGGRIALKAEHKGDEVEVSVTDNGIGIASESFDSIFEMFTQVGSRASHSRGGLGIGLSLVKGLVALHGGTIEARSEGPGRGSEFRVRLPTRLPTPGGPRRAPASARPGPSKTEDPGGGRQPGRSVEPLDALGTDGARGSHWLRRGEGRTAGRRVPSAVVLLDPACPKSTDTRHAVESGTTLGVRT